MARPFHPRTILLAGLVGMLAAPAATAADTVELDDATRTLLEVRTAPATALAQVAFAGLAAEVAAAPSALRVIAAPYAGRVTRVLVDEGDLVAAGAALAEVASADYAAALAALRAADTAAELAASEATRDAELLAEGIIAARRAARSAATRHAREAERRAAASALRGLASGTAGGYLLVAPTPARVLTRAVTPGTALDSLATAFELVEGDARRLEVMVPAALLARAAGATAVRVEGVDLPVTGRAAALDAASQTLHLWASLPGTSPLVIGQRLEVELLAPAPAGALGVARAALLRDGAVCHVLVLSGTTVTPRAVTVLGEDAGQAIVQGELAAGEAVITSGTSALKALLAD